MYKLIQYSVLRNNVSTGWMFLFEILKKWLVSQQIVARWAVRVCAGHLQSEHTQVEQASTARINFHTTPQSDKVCNRKPINMQRLKSDAEFKHKLTAPTISYDRSDTLCKSISILVVGVVYYLSLVLHDVISACHFVLDNNTQRCHAPCPITQLTPTLPQLILWCCFASNSSSKPIIGFLCFWPWKYIWLKRNYKPIFSHKISNIANNFTYSFMSSDIFHQPFNSHKRIGLGHPIRTCNNILHQLRWGVPCSNGCNGA